MDELDSIIAKYKDRPLRKHFENLEDNDRFAIQFYTDAALGSCPSGALFVERFDGLVSTEE